MTTLGVTKYPKINILSDKPAGVAYRVGNPTMMSDYYTPKITLEEGVHRAIQGIL
jgi:hypothetical protein